ncbi:hypothetical protein [Sphingobacterium sp.]|uniref:hypothetical protein n=1 Tax=Sphingobacterium sp. TaxID=341027 RepID=UPI0028A259D8|nr:hypothetical protein [Sphingobacterium sp.]
MNMRQFALILFFFTCFPLFQKLRAQEICASQTQQILPLLTQSLNNNEFTKIDPLLNTLQASCGITEFTERLRILLLIIEKKNSAVEIRRYLDNQFDKNLVQRLDAADRDDFANQYEQNKAKYNFYPLRHALDNLVKIRAKALLISDSYTLNDEEQDILHLFSDTENTRSISGVQVEEQQEAQEYTKPIVYKNRHKAKLGYVPSIGVMGPLSGTNKIFGPNLTLGFMFMSSLEKKFIFEGGIKVRINSNDRNFDYRYEGTSVSINSPATIFMGGAVGYKIYDNDKFILIPKGIIGIDITDTGITENVYSSGFYDEYGYYYDGGYTDRMVTINNVHLGLGLSSLFQMKNKKYIGFELGYHYAPYDSGSKVLTPIQANYGSVELFFRF